MIGDAVIIVGGKDDHVRFNDVHVYNKDPKCSQWTQPHIRGSPPKQRSAHTVNVVQSKVYVFGGHRDGEKFNDVQILDTSCMTWVSPRTKGHPPGKRNAHTATSRGSCLYIFGGFDGESCNDLHCLDTDTLTWSQPQVQGTPPQRRCCHTATLVGDSSMWVFAGKNNDSEGVIDRFNDVHLLDMKEMRWVEVNSRVTGVPPSKRNAHTACGIGHNLLVFGGFDGESCNDLFWFDTQKLLWREITCGSTSPTPRYCHACVCYPTTKSGQHSVLVFGGCDADRNYSDVQVLEIPAEEIPGCVATGPTAELEAELAEVSREKKMLEDTVKEQQELIERLQLQLEEAAELKEKRNKRRRRPPDESPEFPPGPDLDADHEPVDPSEDRPKRRGRRSRRRKSAADCGADDADEEGSEKKKAKQKRRRRRRSQDDDAFDGGVDEPDPVSVAPPPRPPPRAGVAGASPSRQHDAGQHRSVDPLSSSHPGRGRLPSLEGATKGRKTDIFPPLRTDRVSVL